MDARGSGIIMVCPIRISPTKNCAKGNLRAKYDVILYPHAGGFPRSRIVNGISEELCRNPIPYKKSELTPNLGVLGSKVTTSAEAWGWTG